MTRWKERFDVIQNVCEWLLISLMFVAAIFLLVSAASALPPGSTGPVAALFGHLVAIYIYAGVWLGEAVLLALAKWFKWLRIRKWTLMAIFLTHFFTLFLAWNLRGFGVNLIDNFVISALAAWLWLRAKLYYDYIDYEDLVHFDDDD